MFLPSLDILKQKKKEKLMNTFGLRYSFGSAPNLCFIQIQFSVCIGAIQVDKIYSDRILARHETINKILKQFHVLGRRFRHDKNLHAICFFFCP